MTCVGEAECSRGMPPSGDHIQSAIWDPFLMRTRYNGPGQSPRSHSLTAVLCVGTLCLSLPFLQQADASQHQDEEHTDLSNQGTLEVVK